MIFDRIMLPAQGRNEDYKYAQTGSITLVASAGGGGSSTPAPSWLENVIKVDPESGYLSVQDWHVKGNLVIEGQVNQWMAQQLVVDDARIQVNRRQDGVTVDSGLVIYNRDTSSEVSSLVYDVNGIWRAGGSRLFTDDYNPKLGGLPAADYALKTWVENTATAYNAARLGGYAAASYPRKAENATITGAWIHKGDFEIRKHSYASTSQGLGFSADSGAALWNLGVLDASITELQLRRGGIEIAAFNTIGLKLGGGVASERLHVAGNGLFTGDLTAVNAALSGTLGVAGNVTAGARLSVAQAATFGGNVGTSNFASQTQGWRVTPAGVADFRHIYTDELQAKAFTADISQALVGSDILTKSVAKLAQDWTSTANGATSSLYVEELEGFPGMLVFAVGDRLLLRVFDRSGGGLLIKNIWATVASYVSTTDNVQRYTITVNSGGITGQKVYRGSMVLDYDTSGSGVIERTVLDAMGSPYSQVKTWTGSPDNPANYTIHNRTGNLDGIANASGFGFYGENTFLTGKLLVGDLTKAGQ